MECVCMCIVYWQVLHRWGQLVQLVMRSTSPRHRNRVRMETHLLMLGMFQKNAGRFAGAPCLCKSESDWTCGHLLAVQVPMLNEGAS